MISGVSGMDAGEPGPPQDYLKRIEALMRAGDMRRASELAENALEHGFEHPHLLTLLAYRHLDANTPEEALRFAVRASELAPENVDALNAAGCALEKLGRSADAIPYFERALALAPRDFELLCSAAAAFEQAGELRRATELLEGALELDGTRSDIAARLAFIYSDRGELGKARAFGNIALSRDPTQAFASFAIAAADIADGNYEAATQRMRALIEMPRIGRVVRALAKRILGDALHGLNQYADAFAAYEQGAAALKTLYAPPSGVDGELALARARRITAYVSRAPVESWMASGGQCHSPVRAHVFLVGFPRSGTTLLTHVLAAHPQITTLDERYTLADSAEFPASDAGLDRLVGMSEAELDVYRGAYWRRATVAGLTGKESVLVDKMPLYSETLCVIARLFPNAKVLFALRDPRDVVFSCFRRRFAFTRQMYELLTLDGAAGFYDAMMSLAELYRSKLRLPVFNIRHEDLVTDFEDRMRAICEFAGVQANAALETYEKEARLRDIATPNAAQISRGIRRESIGQWRPYTEHMKPVMPVLEPWIRKFGYEAA